MIAHSRRHKDDAVRRLREESARRINRDARWRVFTRGCALASLVGGISLAVLNAHDTYLAEDARRSIDAREAAFADACAARAAALATIEKPGVEPLARAKSEDDSIDALLATFESESESKDGRRARTTKRSHPTKPVVRERSLVDDPALSE